MTLEQYKEYFYKTGRNCRFLSIGGNNYERVSAVSVSGQVHGIYYCESKQAWSISENCWYGIFDKRFVFKTNFYGECNIINVYLDKNKI